MNNISDMRKLGILKKVTFYLLITYLILFVLIFVEGVYKLALPFLVISSLIVMLALIGEYKKRKFMRLTELLEINKKASFFVITTDGVNYELNQKIKKEERKKRVNAIYLVRCIFKRYDDKPCLPPKENKLILKDLLTISKWLKQRGDIDLITFTHGDMHKILSRNFILEPVSSVKKMSCLRWCSITLESRGLLLEKPNDFRYYKLTVKNKNAY
ncbi:hypothetical protein D0439_10220 [Lysinibacillus fusiformis]|uniref:hypothetical protein n=1 Tax=Lysinibacillus fusiformis TaxID=28031 RepID=UPI0011BB7A91|nr:hypothetical protein [Lysinibacillus fusiformis]QDZ98985.1 hypothetical protein D0439_10220 [Lysinibacillus fusiformis]